MSTNTFDAIKRLIHTEVEEHSGKYAGLRAFIEPGRGSIYIEGVNGARICICPTMGTVTFCAGGWNQEPHEVKPL